MVWFCGDIINLSTEVEDLLKLDIFQEGNIIHKVDELIYVSIPHTYIFGSLIIPGFMGNVCDLLKISPPVDNKMGLLLEKCIDLFKGEICTNNIFDKKEEIHAHFYDMRRSYTSANLNMKLLNDFEYSNHINGIKVAIKRSELWTDNMVSYYYAIEKCINNPMACFILLWTMEITIPNTYRLILSKLSKDERYSDFRIFMEKHIYHDEGEHGPVTLWWLNFYLERNSKTSKEIDESLLLVTDAIAKRKNTYSFEATTMRKV